MTTKVALVTGASSGIGEATALKLQDLGYVVYGAARRTDRLEQLAISGVRPLTMDVTSEQSMKAGIEKIINETGRIDVLINNAGYGSYGALEDVELDEGRKQFEVNVFGAVRLIQLALPYMREQRSGTIINVTSIGGKLYTPFGGWYHGTKFALEALSDCLRLELAPFGIDVVVIEPGGIATEWGAIAAKNLKAISGQGPYAAQAKAASGMFDAEASTHRSSPPSVIAETVSKALSRPRPRTRYRVGYGAKPLLTARKLLSDRMYDAIIMRLFNIRK